MRIICPAIALFCVVGSAAAQAPFVDVDLPYSACGDMAELRTNLTGAPDPSARSDAILRRLGVRCVGPVVAPRVRQRY
ncbi:MAG: hypothetical protein WA397_23590 [Roseiarcus sp.]